MKDERDLSELEHVAITQHGRVSQDSIEVNPVGAIQIDERVFAVSFEQTQVVTRERGALDADVRLLATTNQQTAALYGIRVRGTRTANLLKRRNAPRQALASS